MLSGLLSQLKDAETGQRGFIITGDSSYLAPLTAARGVLPEEVDAARQLSARSPAQASDARLLVSLIARRLAEIDTTVALRSSAGLTVTARAVLTNSGKRSMDSVRLVVARMSARARRESAITAAHARAAARIATWALVIGTAVALVLAIAIQVRVMRTARRLERLSQSLESANTALSERNAELAMSMTEAETARSEATAAARAKVDFLAVMSHELRTPLNAILGFGALLEEPGTVTTAALRADYLQRIHDAAHRLLGMVDELLLITRAGPDDASVAEQAIDVVPEIRALVDTFRARADHKGIRLEFVAPALCLAAGDAARIRRVVGHLIDNAVKFTEQGAIRVQVARDDSHVRIDVADTGCGIPSEDLDRIFEPFGQLDQARTRRAEGAGLGLAIARRTAHWLGGEIQVVSAPGSGSTFTLLLRPAHVPAAGAKPARAPAVASEI